MQKLLFILLCFALYAPNVAQLFLYSECTYKSKNNSEQQICDCLLQKNIGANNTPIEKHEHHLVKADWQYIATPNFNFKSQFVENYNLQHTSKYLLKISVDFKNKIFHPPTSVVNILT